MLLRLLLLLLLCLLLLLLLLSLLRLLLLSARHCARHNIARDTISRASVKPNFPLFCILIPNEYRAANSTRPYSFSKILCVCVSSRSQDLYLPLILTSPSALKFDSTSQVAVKFLCTSLINFYIYECIYIYALWFCFPRKCLFKLPID